MATVEIRELVKPETGEKFYPYAHLNGVKGAELLPRIGTSVQTTQPVPIFQVKDALNAQFYPQTHAEAVIGLAQMIESNQFFVKESDGNGGYRIKLKDEFSGFYANGWAAAGGIGSGGGGGGGGGLITSVKGIAYLGTPIANESLTETFSAKAIESIWEAVLGLQQGMPSVSLNNGVSYSTIAINGTSSNFYTKAQVDTLLNTINAFDYVVASSLPTASANTMYKIYLIPSADPQTGNIKDEYITIRGGSEGSYTYSWEQIGSTAIDLTGYATESWVNQQGFLKTETDPTVPAWAKASTKPSYAFSEITNKPTTLSGYGITDALNKNTGGKITGDIYNTEVVEDSEAGEIEVYEMWRITSNGEASFDSLEIGGVGINPGNLVTRSGAQTITGAKTFSGGITMSGANIIPATDNTCKIGESDYRFNQANIRNIYTSYFAFIDGDTKAFRGNFAIGDGYASINIAGSPSSHSYMFYDDSGFFFSGGGVPCGLSGHRWSKVWTVDADLSGSMALGGDIIPATDLGSQLGYSTRRFSNLNVRTLGTLLEINFKNQENTAQTGYLTFKNGLMVLRSGVDIDSSYKQINFHETNGLYPENGSSVNLGYYSSTDNRFRWANIYGVNADLSGDLALAQTSHIDIGPARIEYDATNGAIHVTTNQTGNNAPTIGFYVDGFNAAGGIGTQSGSVKYVNCATQSEYNAIANKSASTIYTIGNPVTKIYLGTIQLYTEN